MEHNDLIAYLYICFFIWGGLAVAVLPFAIAHLLRPRARRSPKATQSYECGITPFGQSWDFRHGISYYLYALMFLAFEVDVLFLYPVAVAFDMVDARQGIATLGAFLGILSLGLVYAWKKGVFLWSSQRKIY